MKARLAVALLVAGGLASPASPAARPAGSALLAPGARPGPEGGSPSGGALPVGSARYRVELGGHPIGVATLALSCGARACQGTWTATLVAPEAAGGAHRTRRIRLELDREGRLAGRVTLDADGVVRAGPALPGAVPASVAEVVLGAALAAGAGGGEDALCVDAFDEESGATGRACARRAAGALAVEVLGVSERVVLDHDGLPREVVIPGQAARFVRDPGATLPARAPPLEVRVPGPSDAAAARRFCGLPPDPPASRPGVPLPAPEAPGASCREKAAAWVSAAERAGHAARTAVGVAHDGTGFVWHAWAEVLVDGRWVPVDPAFGELPADGPRFTVARHAPGDGPGRAEAGGRILACWGRATVQ